MPPGSSGAKTTAPCSVNSEADAIGTHIPFSREATSGNETDVFKSQEQAQAEANARARTAKLKLEAAVAAAVAAAEAAAEAAAVYQKGLAQEATRTGTNTDDSNTRGATGSETSDEKSTSSGVPSSSAELEALSLSSPMDVAKIDSIMSTLAQAAVVAGPVETVSIICTKYHSNVFG